MLPLHCFIRDALLQGPYLRNTKSRTVFIRGSAKSPSLQHRVLSCFRTWHLVSLVKSSMCLSGRRDISYHHLLLLNSQQGDVMENPQWQEAYAPSTCCRSPLGTHVVAHSIPSALTQAVQGPPALSCTQHPLPLTCSSQHKPTWLQPAVTLRRSWWKLHRSHDQVLLRTGHGRAELLLLPAATGRLAVSFLYFYPSKRAVIAISYRWH